MFQKKKSSILTVNFIWICLFPTGHVSLIQELWLFPVSQPDVTTSLQGADLQKKDNVSMCHSARKLYMIKR